MRNLILYLILFASICCSKELNLSPSYEKEIVNNPIKRVLNREARMDVNQLFKKMMLAYQKGRKEGVVDDVEYLVSSYDLAPAYDYKTKNIIRFSERRTHYTNVDDYAKCVIFVTKEDVIEKDNVHVLVFKHGDNVYRSCLYRKVNNPKKKEKKPLPDS